MTQAKELAALADRLEISGADRTRWPAQERLRFASLIASSDEARRLMAEASALDRLLDTVTGADPARLGGLVDRIVAAAVTEGAPGSGNVIAIGAGRRSVAPAPRLPVHRRSNWQAAALLAASLFVGAFVGTSGLLGPGASTLGGEFDVAEADFSDYLIGNDDGLLEDDTL
jgi:hypothetical protein